MTKLQQRGKKKMNDKEKELDKVLINCHLNTRLKAREVLNKAIAEERKIFNLDYWMYGIMIEQLKDNLRKLLKKYLPETFERAKDNRFHNIGKLNLCIKKLEKIRNNHSLVAEQKLNEAREE